MYMDFKSATEGLAAPELARLFGVSPQTIRQYRLDPSLAGHRRPPAGWQVAVAGLLTSKSSEYLDRARLLADQLESP